MIGAEGGGIDSVLRIMRGCNRSQPHMDVLRHAIAILANLARYPQLHMSLLASQECVQVIAEQLQLLRDKEVRQIAAIAILSFVIAQVLSSCTWVYRFLLSSSILESFDILLIEKTHGMLKACK